MQNRFPTNGSANTVAVFSGRTEGCRAGRARNPFKGRDPRASSLPSYGTLSTAHGRIFPHQRQASKSFLKKVVQGRHKLFSILSSCQNFTQRTHIMRQDCCSMSLKYVSNVCSYSNTNILLQLSLSHIWPLPHIWL